MLTSDLSLMFVHKNMSIDHLEIHFLVVGFSGPHRLPRFKFASDYATGIYTLSNHSKQQSAPTPITPDTPHTENPIQQNSNWRLNPANLWCQSWVVVLYLCIDDQPPWRLAYGNTWNAINLTPEKWVWHWPWTSFEVILTKTNTCSIYHVLTKT